ncbi:MAG TPA: 50S ribosomal protein L11 methyltransferase [Burkholderiales bacterium]|nr:50S ribosomal protein L11 methyltransferase [Burkholderiales bacterium]
MAWLALTLQVERSAAEAFSDALLEAGAQSVSLEISGSVTAILSLEEDSNALIADAARAAGIAPPAYSVETLDDQDWVRASQAQFAPVAIGERLWIGPGWHQPPSDRIAVRIDPGLAFGTGSHPSTQLVLGFLEKSIGGGERLLDYGCGSGILAIAAAKLGAAHVDAVDLDPEAVETTRANALANGVEVNSALPDALPATSYDIVVSNILAQPLIVLAPLLASRGARIALSGILEAQAEEVARAYERWFEMRIADRDDGWVLVLGVKK